MFLLDSTALDDNNLSWRHSVTLIWNYFQSLGAHSWKNFRSISHLNVDWILETIQKSF